MLNHKKKAMRKKINLLMVLMLIALAQIQSALAQCAFPILTGASTSGNARAPIGNFNYNRGAYIITAAEMAAAGFVAGTITSIQWSFAAAPSTPSAAVTGNLAVYFENTSDVTYNKAGSPTTWATNISTMTNSRPSSTYTLPGAAGSYTVPITSPFNYTGGGLYVAFEWSNPTNPLSSGALILCNTALATGLRSAQSNTSLPAVLGAVVSAFRPVTTLFGAVPPANDAKVDYVYQYGKMPLTFAANRIISARISNKGTNTLTNVPVSLNISGANSFSPAAVIIPTLAACSSINVDFAAFTPSSLGSNTVTVTVPSDDNNANNSVAVSQLITPNLYDTRTSGETNSGGVGFTGGTGSFIGKFSTAVPAIVNEVQVDFTTSGFAYRLGIYDATGPGGTPGALLYTDASDRTTSIGTAFAAISPAVNLPAGDFYVGIRQTGTSNVGFQFTSLPVVRTGDFYYASPLPENGTWTEFSGAAPTFRLNIAVQFYVPSPPNCAISLLPANAANPFCYGGIFSWASGGNGPTGYDVYLSQNQTDVNNDAPAALVSSNQAGTTYDPGILAGNTVYYWKVVPRNIDGPATGCTTQSFTTGTAPSLPLTEDFSAAFPPSCWTRSSSVAIIADAASAYGAGTGSAKFDFYNNGPGNFDLTTPNFANSPVGYVLSFDFAYATFVNEIDQLEILTSSNNGNSYSSLVLLNGGTNGILNTGGASTGAFTPTSGQWASYQIVLPTGTNRIMFRGVSVFGNNLYLDNISINTPPPPPNCAIGFTPADLATNQFRDVVLSWSNGGGNPTGYDVYLDQNPNPVTLVSANQLPSFYATSGLLANATYYWKVVPKNISGDAVACGIQSFTTGNLFNYCTAAHSVGCGNGNITNVSMRYTLNNTTTCTAPAFELFPASGSTTTSLPIGQAHNLSVTTDAPCIVSVWIDYDQNGIFDASEWTQVTTSSTTNVASSVSISIPPTAATGQTRMRVRTRFAANPNAATDACTSFGSGETEDYIITLLPASVNEPSCATSISVTNSTCVTATGLSWSDGGGYPTGYYVYVSTDFPMTNFIVFQGGGTSATSFTLPPLLPNATYYYQVTAFNAVGESIGCSVGNFLSGASQAVTPNQSINSYTLGAEGVTVPALPCGITRENYDGQGDAQWFTSTVAPFSGTNHMRINKNTDNTTDLDDWFFSPPINVVAGRVYRLNWYDRIGSGSTAELYKAYIAPSPDATTMESSTLIYSGSTNSTTYAQRTSNDYLAVSTGQIYFGFRAESPAGVNQTSLYLDNIQITEIPVSALAPGSCTTIPSMYDQIYIQPVLGATNYRFRIVGTGGQAGYDFVHYRNNANVDYRLKWAPGVIYGYTYNVSVGYYKAGVWSPYGASCPVTMGPFPASKLRNNPLTVAGPCDYVISDLNQQLFADSVSGSNDYMYKIVEDVPGGPYDYDQTWQRYSGNLDYRLVWGYQASPLVERVRFGYSYDVQVRSLVGKTGANFGSRPGEWGPYGTTCKLDLTAASPTTSLTNCGGINLTSLNDQIFATPVAGATNYQYELTGPGGYFNTAYRNNGNNDFRLTWIPTSPAPGGVSYATTYSVRVRAYVGGVWLNYGTACNVTTPAAPTSTVPALCGALLGPVTLAQYTVLQRYRSYPVCFPIHQRRWSSLQQNNLQLQCEQYNHIVAYFGLLWIPKHAAKCTVHY